MSGKGIMKGFGVIFVALVAIGINAIGYKRNIQEQYNQRVILATNSIQNQIGQITEIQTNLDKVCLPENSAFLRSDLTLEELDNIESNIGKLKVTADDFFIDKKDLSKESGNYATVKDGLQKKQQELAKKFQIQETLQTFFENESMDWQTIDENISIQKELTIEKLAEVREALKFVSEDEWNKNIISYLNLAQEQLEQINNVQELVDAMIKEGQVTENATYANYLELNNQVNQIINNNWHEKFKQISDIIAIQIGLY